MRRAALVAVLAALAVAQPAHAAPATITMSGSVVTQALVADLAYFYRHSGVPDPPRFSLTGGVTATGIADLQRGIADGAMVSRALQPGDPPGLVFTRIARSGLCLVTNRSNPVPGITDAEVQGIVAGTITTWAQIAGARRTDAIVPVGRDGSTGAAQVFESVFVDPATPVLYRPLMFASDPQVRDFIAETPAAFGYVDLALSGPLHSMAFDGVACSTATIRAGTYPGTRPLGIVTRGRPRGALARFLRWTRTSRTARRVIATRYVPG
jgi:phosphate transport system substrate-binding protein